MRVISINDYRIFGRHLPLRHVPVRGKRAAWRRQSLQFSGASSDLRLSRSSTVRRRHSSITRGIVRRSVCFCHSRSLSTIHLSYQPTSQWKNTLANTACPSPGPGTQTTSKRFETLHRYQIKVRTLQIRHLNSKSIHIC